jgi:hypothetical protein
MEQELTGTLVLISPGLSDDPAGCRGQTGVVATFNLDRNEVQVGFGHGPVRAFSTHDLFILRPHNELYRDLLNQVQNLEVADFKNLMHISMLIQHDPNNSQIRQALELAASSNTAMVFSTVPLNEQLGIAATQDPQLNFSFGR